MLTKTKMAVAAVFILGSASASFAQGLVPEYDGDANPIPGQYDMVAPPRPAFVARGYAAELPGVTAPSDLNGPEWRRTFNAWLQ
jgi:hypothetical protein